MFWTMFSTTIVHLWQFPEPEGPCDEVHLLTLSGFKGIVPVGSTQQRDGFTEGGQNLHRETFNPILLLLCHLFTVESNFFPTRS